MAKKQTKTKAARKPASEATDMILVPTGESSPVLHVSLPVFTLAPHPGSQARAKGKGKARTRSYGGHDLLVSGSMGEVAPPSFTLTRAR
jgi:hypothetical protein